MLFPDPTSVDDARVADTVAHMLGVPTVTLEPLKRSQNHTFRVRNGEQNLAVRVGPAMNRARVEAGAPHHSFSPRR